MCCTPRKAAATSHSAADVTGTAHVPDVCSTKPGALPAAHDMKHDSPATVLVVPAGQAAHAALPCAAVNFPAAHGVQLVALVCPTFPELPAAHTVPEQFARPAVAACWPERHGAQPAQRHLLVLVHGADEASAMLKNSPAGCW